MVPVVVHTEAIPTASKDHSPASLPPDLLSVRSRTTVRRRRSEVNLVDQNASPRPPPVLSESKACVFCFRQLVHVQVQTAFRGAGEAANSPSFSVLANCPSVGARPDGTTLIGFISLA